MSTASSRVTRVSNCGGELIRKWEDIGVKYGISHHWVQPDSESLQSKLTSVTGFSQTASHVESNTTSVKL